MLKPGSFAAFGSENVDMIIAVVVGAFKQVVKDTAGLFGIDTAIRRLKAPRANDPTAGRSSIAYLIAAGLPAFDELRREAACWANIGW